ncbi:MAG TPA: peptidylprolyl isomerase, partial [Terriglobales bacterium]|nr:peptidylprolyl isomerase [Terriglobales bacterium]
MIPRQLSLCFISLLASLSMAAQNAAGPGPASSSSPTPHPAQAGTVAPAQAPAPPSTPPLSAVPENTAVITIDGICGVALNGTVKRPAQPAAAAKSATAAKTTTGKTSTAPADCKTEVTRGEFERLTKTVAAGAPVTVYRQIASRYVQVLTAANQGVKLGVDKDAEFNDQLNEQLALVRLQMLAQYAERKLQAEAANISDAEEKAYYDQNPPAFEQVTLTRIFVPRAPAGNPAGTGAGTQPATAPPDSDAIAENARKQLLAGDDAEKIQKSVYEQLKNTSAPPTTNFGTRRRGALPPAQEQKVFALNSHDVSEVMSDSIGHVIYRVESKQVLPFDQVKDEIKRKMTQQRLEDSRQKIMSASNADYNVA